MRIAGSLATLLVAGSVWVAAGQTETPQAPRATFRSSTELVQVDVSVLDGQRRPVQGLSREDFTLLEDGKPRPIVAFTAVSLPKRAEGPVLGSWMREVAPDVTTNDLAGEGRVVILLFDRSIPPGAESEIARSIGRAAIDQLGPSDVAAVVSTGIGGMFQGLTSDRARLRNAIDRTDASSEVSGEASAIEQSLGVINSPQGSGQCYCGVCVLDAITNVVEAVRDIDRRRKSLLFIGSDLAVESADADCGPRLNDARRRMFRALDLGNITIHAFDPRGLETLAATASGRARIPPSVNLSRQANLQILPHRTGGRVVNGNTPLNDLPAVFEESNSYYLLGFEPASRTADGRQHKIEVKVQRRGVEITSRRAYVSPSAMTAPTPAAIQSALPARGVSMSINAAAFAQPASREALVAVTVGVRQPSSAALGASRLVVGAFSPRGLPVQTVRQTIDVQRLSSGLPDTVFEIWSKLTLRPGRYEIRAGLEQEGTKTPGGAYTYLDVPDFTKSALMMSDAILTVAPPRAGGPVALFRPLLDKNPTTQRTFMPTDRVVLGLRLYNGGHATQPVAMTARLRDTADGVKFEERRQVVAADFDSSGACEYQLPLPIGGLSSGEYLLTIEGTQGTTTARRAVRFTIAR